MQPFELQTPVVFIVFNRPDTTARVFREIARARPPKLLVIADGPRPGRPNDAERCLAARTVATAVDWPCELITQFSDENLGCRQRVASGLDWAFSLVEEAIILEDDCLPDPSFFRFCEELLKRYRSDGRVAHIGGTSFQDGNRRADASYYFSRHNHVWGWATWRRAWVMNDIQMQAWADLRDRRWLRRLLGSASEARFWGYVFDQAADKKIDAWSYAWIFSTWRNDMLSIVPSTNLICNIGFGPEATHTTAMGPLAEMKTYEIEFPLLHPPTIVRNERADAYTDRRIFTRSPLHQLVRWLKQHAPSHILRPARNQIR